MRRIVGSTSQLDVPDLKVTQHSALCDPLVPQTLSSRLAQVRVKPFIQRIEIIKMHADQTLEVVLESLPTNVAP
ncbi:hypothetical protein [Stenotrophomonas sp. NPDC077659]|uniref:hypothetical protein n=1 Tax=Stenotrophomonas sp. NPDC077659 TaxID=3390694 RepID=UPI003D06006A